MSDRPWSGPEFEPSPASRVCLRCRQEKPVEEFPRHRFGDTGERHPGCNSCLAEYFASWRRGQEELESDGFFDRNGVEEPVRKRLIALAVHFAGGAEGMHRVFSRDYVDSEQLAAADHEMRCGFEAIHQILAHTTSGLEPGDDSCLAQLNELDDLALLEVYKWMIHRVRRQPVVTGRSGIGR